MNDSAYLYVVDDDDLLKGVVSARRLLLSPADKPLVDIMIQEVITISRVATILDACEMFIAHRLLAIPVVDDQRRLLGAVDIDTYAEELSGLDKREGNDELFQLIGVQLADARHTSPVKAFPCHMFGRSIPWRIRLASPIG